MRAGFGERELSSVKPIIYEDPNSEIGQDLNSVDMDREQTELMKNDVKYSAATPSHLQKICPFEVCDRGG